ncbi:MAG: SPOR domain-containing protein [Gemmatimonadaceae bacterium]
MIKEASAPPVATPAGWERAGRRIAPMLGSYSAAVITSSDVLAAAHVAIGIGLAEAEHRRVAIADLVGEVEPIQSLVTSDDPHGISDSFTYGVSLNKIAQPIDTTGNLFVMPSGTGSVSDPAIFANSRWQRLANGFREVGALLIIVAPADAAGLKELIDQTDGVVLVGGTPLDLAPYINVLARVPAPSSGAPPGETKKALPLWQIAALLLVLVAIVGSVLYFRNANEAAVASKRPAFGRPTVAATTPPVGALAPVAPETLTVPPPVNVADSAAASAYAVELGAWNAPEDATDQVMRFRSTLPAAAISPVPTGANRETYYKVISGAFPTQPEAQALLDQLRYKGVVQDGLGTVVRTPYALLLDSAAAGHTQRITAKYVRSRQTVYVLAQPNGSLKVYAGAFERPEDAASLLATLRAAQFNPTLVYRTGRTP